MKKIVLISMLLLFFNAYAQDKNEVIINSNNLNEDLKSGNYKDILTSFFQLASTNLTGNDKTIEMNTTLFALKAKANPVLLTGNFKRERFTRNFQFNFKVNLDDKYKYKGFTGGATYAIVNGRDRRLAMLTNTIYGKEFGKFRALVEEILPEINVDLSDDDTSKLSKAMENIADGKKDLDNDNRFYDIIIRKFKEKAKNSPDIKNQHKEIEGFVAYLEALEADEYKKIDGKLLWTLSVDGTAAEKGKFNKASISTILLQGIKDSKCEIDFRSKLVYADTITASPIPRMDFNVKLAANFKLARGANHVSFFETKIGMEYNSILKNILPTEKKETFLGNAEIRVRILDDLWLPLIIKYDFENANFLGFLNISYNLGSFKKTTK